MVVSPSFCRRSFFREFEPAPLSRRTMIPRIDISANFLIGRVAVIKTNTDFAHLDRCPLGRRALIGDRDRLLLGLAIDEKETSDDLLGFGEGAIDDCALATSNLQAYAFGIRPQRVAGLEHAAGFEVFGKAQHALIGKAPLFRR